MEEFLKDEFKQALVLNDSKLVPQDEILDFIGKNVKEHSDCINKNHLDLIRKLFENSLNDDSENIKNFEYWCQKTKYIKLVHQEIPSYILKNASLCDVKVQTRGPDDFVFDRNDQIRAKIARGNTILEYEENGSTKYKLLIYALRKFTGGLGDEDEIDRKSGQWRKYFLKDLKNTKHVISLQKANGEAAHLSCSWINNDFLICAGSKNVHLVFKNKGDISSYSDQRPFLQFITFTENKVYDKPRTLCPIPPDCAIELGNVFGLSGVQYSKIPLDEIDDYLIKVRKDYRHEGVVLYFVDSELNIIGMLKKKTCWYIIIRAIREKVKSYISPRSKMSVMDLKSKMKKRLYEIRAWIGFNDKDLEKWERLCNEFCDWFDTQNRLDSKIKTDFNERYPVVWNKFLKEKNFSDTITIHIEKSSYTKLGEESEEELADDKKTQDENEE